MTRKEQKQFVKNITSSIAAEIISKIESGKIPENWDGYELRELIADKAASETYLRNRKDERFSDYKNTVLVSNI